MPETKIIERIFSAEADLTTPGSGLIDRNAVGWRIQSGKLTNGGLSYLTNHCVAATPVTDARLRVKTTATIGLLSARITTSGAGYGAAYNTSDGFFLLRFDTSGGGGGTTVDSGSGGGGGTVAPVTLATSGFSGRDSSAAVIEIEIIGSTVTARLYNDSNPNTPLATVTATDTTYPNSGDWGVRGYGNDYTYFGLWQHTADTVVNGTPTPGSLYPYNLTDRSAMYIVGDPTNASGVTGTIVQTIHSGTTTDFVPNDSNRTDSDVHNGVSGILANLSPSTSYYMKVKAVDSRGTIGIGNAVPFTTLAALNRPTTGTTGNTDRDIPVAFVGDSITQGIGGGNLTSVAAAFIERCGIPTGNGYRRVVPLNLGQSGSSSAMWRPDSALVSTSKLTVNYYHWAVASIVAAAADAVVILLGANDCPSYAATTQADFAANIGALANGLLADCPTLQRVLLVGAPYRGDTIVHNDPAALARLGTAYPAALTAVATAAANTAANTSRPIRAVDPSRLFEDGARLYNRTAGGGDFFALFPDGIHPNSDGAIEIADTMGSDWAAAFFTTSSDNNGGGGGGTTGNNNNNNDTTIAQIAADVAVLKSTLLPIRGKVKDVSGLVRTASSFAVEPLSGSEPLPPGLSRGFLRIVGGAARSGWVPVVAWDAGTGIFRLADNLPAIPAPGDLFVWDGWR